jgi:CheY-like chemotaxis protein
MATFADGGTITGIEPLAFTDIQMPGTMDGIELSRYVRKRWPPTIIVVSSGHCRPTNTEMASDALFVPKPYVRRHYLTC